MASAGDVGKYVIGRPGYMGYIPSSEIPPIPVKIGCAERDPNAFQLRPSTAKIPSPRRNIQQLLETNLLTHMKRPQTVYQMEHCTYKKLPSVRTQRFQTITVTRGREFFGTTIYKENFTESNTVYNKKVHEGETQSMSVHTIVPHGKKFQTVTTKTSYQIDIGVRGENPRSRIENRTLKEATTTNDLWRGTRKFSNHVPGYMGHVPEYEENLGKIPHSKPDPARAHLKEYWRNSMNYNIPGYAGYQPISVKNERGAVKPTKKTTTGFYYRQHPLDLSDRKAKTGMIKKLFVQGGGRDGAAAAEKFFKHYRPFEGEVKMGPPEERKWISDLQLKRSYIFSSTF